MPRKPPYDPEAHLPEDFEYTDSPVGTGAEEVARARRKLTGLIGRAQQATGAEASRLGAQAAYMLNDIEKRGVAVEMDTDSDTADIMDSDEIFPIARPLTNGESQDAQDRIQTQTLPSLVPEVGDMIREAYATVWHPFRADCVRSPHSHWPREWSLEATKKIQEKFAHDR